MPTPVSARRGRAVLLAIAKIDQHRFARDIGCERGTDRRTRYLSMRCIKPECAFHQARSMLPDGSSTLRGGQVTTLLSSTRGTST